MNREPSKYRDDLSPPDRTRSIGSIVSRVNASEPSHGINSHCNNVVNTVSSDINLIASIIIHALNIATTRPTSMITGSRGDGESARARARAQVLRYFLLTSLALNRETRAKGCKGSDNEMEGE